MLNIKALNLSRKLLNIGSKGVLKKIEVLNLQRELQSYKLNVISIDILILKKLLEQVQFHGLKPKHITINSVIRKRETSNVPHNHTSALMKEEFAAVTMVSFITVILGMVSKLVYNGTQSTKINNLKVVKQTVKTQFLVTHCQESERIASVKNGKSFLHSLSLKREKQKFKTCAHLQPFTLEPTKMGQKFLTLRV